ncbi:bile acid:sodium symporter [Williamsia sp. 1135]|jgi:ACR3 family arsenite efflux pump ArsB|uniref:arsenic resistance protein n=1 Tax=Williamsia sp. 1135 TaxID=1889262 RepID=UPI000A11B3A8|nr:bile acid:sodium symporter [Williamsia sp. 1135]ORM37215.1 arsenic resistance protein [Williamsia sp. 1135]
MTGLTSSPAVAWLEKFQIPLYLAALAAGALIGIAAPNSATTFEHAINPVLIVLLYATFLAVPFQKIRASLRDGRFLVSVVVLNFVVVPVVVFALTRFIADDQALLVGVLLVLLAPCIDYVIVFSGLAGAASERLLASAPLIMLLQMALLPVYLWLFVGSDLVEIVDIGPFVEAFVLLIVVPLCLAAITQAIARRHHAGIVVMDAMAAAMVPVMMLTLAVVVASQIEAVRTQWSSLIAVVPIFVGFLIIMAIVGLAVGRAAHLDVPATRALIFSGATRNSLVVLPLALALPQTLALAAVVVVTQTLVELVGMIIYVRLIPRITPSSRPVSRT